MKKILAGIIGLLLALTGARAYAAAPTISGHTLLSDTSGGSLSSLATTSTLNVASGSSLVVVCRISGSPTVTVTDTAGDSFGTAIISSSTAAIGMLEMFFVSSAIANSAETFTCHYSTSNSYGTVMAVNLTSATLDVNTLGSSTSATNCTVPSSGGFATSTAQEIAIEAGSINAVGATFTAGTIATVSAALIDSDAAGGLSADESATLSSVQASATGTINDSSHDWACVLATFYTPAVAASHNLSLLGVGN